MDSVINSKNYDSNKNLLYGVGIAAGAAVGIVMAPSVLSSAGYKMGKMAAGSMTAGVKDLIYQGAIAGLVTMTQSPGITGVGIVGDMATSTITTALGEASSKAVRCFVKEFTRSLKKGISPARSKNEKKMGMTRRRKSGRLMTTLE